MCRRFEVGLFAISEQGTRLVGRSEDLKLIRLLREQIAADCRRELGTYVEAYSYPVVEVAATHVHRDDR